MVHCSAVVWVWLRSDIDVFTCFFICIFFFSYSPIFLFSHKTMPRCRPETRTYQRRMIDPIPTVDGRGIHLLMPELQPVYAVGIYFVEAYAMRCAFRKQTFQKLFYRNWWSFLWRFIFELLSFHIYIYNYIIDYNRYIIIYI